MKMNRTIYTAIQHMTGDDVLKFVKAYKEKEVGCIELENLVVAWDYSGRKSSMVAYPKQSKSNKLPIARLIKFLKETWKMSDMEIMEVLDHMLFSDD